MTPITQIAEYKRSLKPSLDSQLGGYAGPWLSAPDALGLYHDKRHVEGAKRVVDESRVIKLDFDKGK